mmetsp:Transcript_44059/g.102891  ORF Transcript_44059/g.102891 Transcript_44059/m.102891 type:complete len:455 (-) Transcript_44059:116-1480(-)
MGAQCVKPQHESVEFYKTPSVALFPVETEDDDELETSSGVGCGSSDADSATPTVRASAACSPPHCVAQTEDDEATPAPYQHVPIVESLSDYENQSEQVTPRVVMNDYLKRPVEEDGLMEEESLSTIKSRLISKELMVQPEDMVLKRVLCTTYKSTVCLADWRGRTAVVKRIKRDLVDKDDEDSKETRETSVREMLHEMHILTAISHPCLVNLLGANVDREQEPLFVTEFMESGDVETYMHKQRQSSYNNSFKPRFSLALQWATSTAEALAYLHGLNHPIIHRDLKPLNLLLTKDLQVKVTDFGISKVLPYRRGCLQTDTKPAPKMTGGVGTWRYMAPEVVRYEQYTDRVDIYSLSLIVYFIFSGRQPFFSFCGPDPEKILKAYIAGKEPRPDLDQIHGAELKHFLEDAWHPKASMRPSAAECVDRLQNLRTHGMLHSVTNMTKSLGSWKRAVSH